jgi:hypothetical protein
MLSRNGSVEGRHFEKLRSHGTCTVARFPDSWQNEMRSRQKTLGASSTDGCSEYAFRFIFFRLNRGSPSLKV